MNDLLELLIGSFARPRAVAARVLAMNISVATAVEAAVAVTAIGVVMSYIGVMLNGGPADPVSAMIIGNPLLGAAAQFAMTLIIAGMTTFIGRRFGGDGDFRGALSIVVWLNAVLVIVQFAQLFALAFAPPLAVLLTTAAFFWALWAFANFVTELHGFQNPFVVLAGVVLSSIALFFILAMTLSMLGITPQEVS